MQQKVLMIKNYVASLSGLAWGILVIALSLLTSCSKEDMRAESYDHAKDSHLELPVNLNIGQGMTDSEARIIITERPATPSRPKGIDFGWKKDDIIEPVYVHLTQGATKVVVEGKITILEDMAGAGTYKAKLSVDFPASINTKVKQGQFEGGVITMAAAFGVNKVSDDGIAEVAEREAFLEGEAEDNPPMYTAASPLTLKVDEDTHELVPQWGGTFRLFGLFLRLRIENKSNMRYSPVLLSIGEGAFESSANFDIRTGKKTEGLHASDKKGVEASFKARYVPAETTKSFYIWAYGLNKKAKSTASLYSSASYPEPDVKKNITLTAAPENGKVYDLPLKPVPQNGDLIITKVYCFYGETSPVDPYVHTPSLIRYGAAIEIYNPTDTTIDPRKYTLNGRSFLENLSSSSLYYDDAQWEPSRGEWRESNYIMLPPRGIILIEGYEAHMGPSIKRSSDWKDLYPGLRYRRRFLGDETPYALRPGYQGSQLALGKDGKIVDMVRISAVIGKDRFGYNNLNINIMRKPGRDIPRQQMKLGEDTDWVMRPFNGLGAGNRFGYYYDPSRVGTNFHGVRWIHDHSSLSSYDSRTDNRAVGSLKESPLLLRPRYGVDERVDRYRDEAPYYTPPKWWTKEMAEAADRP